MSWTEEELPPWIILEIGIFERSADPICFDETNSWQGRSGKESSKNHSWWSKGSRLFAQKEDDTHFVLKQIDALNKIKQALKDKSYRKAKSEDNATKTSVKAQ